MKESKQTNANENKAGLFIELLNKPRKYYRKWKCGTDNHFTIALTAHVSQTDWDSEKVFHECGCWLYHLVKIYFVTIIVKIEKKFFLCFCIFF